MRRALAVNFDGEFSETGAAGLDEAAAAAMPSSPPAPRSRQVRLA